MSDVGASRRHVGLLVAIGALVLAGLVAVLAYRDDADPLSDARGILHDDSAFARPSEAGAALTQVSVHLAAAADDCDAERSFCQTLFAAAAHARVSAISILRCGRPELFEFHRSFRAYVDELAADTPAPSDLPPGPAC